jgi:hypothetical protein
MNGRVYDPMIGRFLSPDPYVQAPGHSQSYNRYSYVLNNPLKYTDPTGEFWNFVAGAVIGAGVGYISGRAAGLKGNDLLAYTLGSAAVGLITSGIGTAVSAGVSSAFSLASNAFTVGLVSGAAGGAAAGLVAGAGMAAIGNTVFGTDNSLGQAAIRGGISGALIGGVFGGLGGGFQNKIAGRKFFSGAFNRSEMAYQYTVSNGVVQQLPDHLGGQFGGSDFHMFNVGTWGDNGSSFKLLYSFMVEGSNAIKAFQFWNTSLNALSVSLNPLLVFDGANLSVLSANKVQYSTTATSGKDEHMNNPNSQHIKDYGPTPEGIYIIDNTKWDHLNKYQQLKRLVAGGDWGEYNVPLRPVTYKGPRNSFYLHGGIFPGSAGCIDAGQNVANIYNYLNSKGTTVVIIRY